MNKNIATFKLIVVSCLLLVNWAFVSKSSSERETGMNNKFETRYGWFENPTPNNAWLNDKDGQWIVSVQGGHSAEGDWPDFTLRQWVETNGSYGYGCACLQAEFNQQTHDVLEIKKADARPLAACRRDRLLKEPK